jgi:hypothetical protein
VQRLLSASGAELAAARLRESHQRVTRVSVLDDLFNPLPGLVFTGADGYTINGSVSQDASKIVRRSLSLSLANPKGVWTPTGPDDPFYWNRLLRVERGVVSGGVEYYAPLGVFLIDTPSVDSRRLSISGADRVDRALRSKFTEPTTYASGSGVGAAIKDMLVDAGIGADMWTIDDGGAVLGAARSYEADDERMGAAKSLATDFGLEVFADANGFVVVRPKRDPADLPVVWEFMAGPDATMLGVSKSWSREKFYNHVVAIGESADEAVAVVRAEASIDDPASPLRVDGPMGDRLYTYKSAMITTVGQAQAVADSLLWEHALIEEELKVELVPHPGLEAGDAVRVVDPDSRTDDSYMIDAITTPLAGGSSSLSVHKSRTA